jgi:hypothetical protein
MTHRRWAPHRSAADANPGEFRWPPAHCPHPSKPPGKFKWGDSRPVQALPSPPHPDHCRQGDDDNELVSSYKIARSSAVKFLEPLRPLNPSLIPSVPHHHPEEFAGVHHHAINRDHLGGHGLAEEVRRILVSVWKKSSIEGRTTPARFLRSLSSEIIRIHSISSNSGHLSPFWPSSDHHGELTSLWSYLLHRLMNHSSDLVVDRRSPPRESSPELTPVTKRWRRKHR